jgi:hypothetical protein
MPPVWSEVREALAAAIRAALPLQLRAAQGEPIAGIALDMDAYYGSSGLYLLTESAARALPPDAVDNIGDWPISTHWSLDADHAQAFALHWGAWEKWFYEHIDDPAADDEQKDKFRALLRVACEAMWDVGDSGDLAAIAKSDRFKIIIAEHDEPNALSLDRYELFVRTGRVRCHGDVT